MLAYSFYSFDKLHHWHKSCLAQMAKQIDIFDNDALIQMMSIPLGNLNQGSGSGRRVVSLSDIQQQSTNDDDKSIYAYITREIIYNIGAYMD